MNESIKFVPGDEFTDEDLYCIEAHRRDRILNVLIDSGQVKEIDDEILADEYPIASEYPVHLGGPWFLMPDGSKVKGKNNALKAL